MELLAKFGTEAQKRRWLLPLLRGEVRSAFLMTEPDVASSDARNIATRADLSDDGVTVSGRKWWATGACHPNCAVFLTRALFISIRGRAHNLHHLTRACWQSVSFRAKATPSS